MADPWSVSRDQDMRSVIRSRERRLKGGLARLSNPRALENWSGESGLGRLSFRWPNARLMVQDIEEGLNRAVEAA